MGVDTIFELARPDGIASGIAAFTLKFVVVVMVWPYAPRPEASASASRPHFSTVVIVAQPHAAGDCAFVAVVVFILLPCWYRVRFVLLCAFMDLWLSGSIIRLVRRRSGIGEFGNALLGYRVSAESGPASKVGGTLDGVGVAWNSGKAYLHPVRRSRGLANQVQGSLCRRKDLDHNGSGGGAARIILNGVGEHVDPDEIGGGRVDDIRAGERHRPAIGAVRAYVTDGKRCGDVLRRSGEQLIH